MKTLTISIKQICLDQILAGNKTVLTREIKPSNATKHVYFVDSATNTHYKRWADIPDGVGDILIEPVSYDALNFITRAHKGTHSTSLDETRSASFQVRPLSNPEGAPLSGLEEARTSCLVEVKSAEIFFLVDENNEKILYDADDLEFPAMVIDYLLGSIFWQNNS